MKHISKLAIAALTTSIGTVAAAETITNGIADGTIGFLSVNAGNAGDTNTVNVTLNGANSGVGTEEIVFDYYSYIDTGSGGERLANSATGSRTVT